MEAHGLVALALLLWVLLGCCAERTSKSQPPESLILRGPSGFDLLGKSTELKRHEAKPHAFCPQQQTPHAPPTVDEFKGVVSQRSSGSTLGLLVCRRDAGWTPADAPQVLAVDGLLTLELELNLIGKVLPDDRADVVPESGARVVLAGSVLRGTRRPKSESMPIGLVCTVPPVALFSGPGDLQFCTSTGCDQINCFKLFSRIRFRGIDKPSTFLKRHLPFGGHIHVFEAVDPGFQPHPRHSLADGRLVGQEVVLCCLTKLGGVPWASLVAQLHRAREGLNWKAIRGLSK